MAVARFYKALWQVVAAWVRGFESHPLHNASPVLSPLVRNLQKS